MKSFGIEWHVPYYIQSMEQKETSSQPFLSQITTELQYVERFIFNYRSIHSKFMDIRIGVSRTNKRSYMD